MKGFTPCWLKNIIIVYEHAHAHYAVLLESTHSQAHTNESPVVHAGINHLITAIVSRGRNPRTARLRLHPCRIVIYRILPVSYLLVHTLLHSAITVHHLRSTSVVFHIVPTVLASVIIAAHFCRVPRPRRTPSFSVIFSFVVIIILFVRRLCLGRRRRRHGLRLKQLLLEREHLFLERVGKAARSDGDKSSH